MNRTSTRKRRAGFNLFDLFVLLVIGAVGALAFILISGNDTIGSGGSPVTVTYRVEIENVSTLVRDSARTNVSVRDGVRKTPLGTITNLTYHNAYFMEGNAETGEVVKATVDNRFNVVLTCQANGVLEGGRVKIGDYTMAVGTAVSLQSTGISGTGYCISLSYEELS